MRHAPAMLASALSLLVVTAAAAVAGPWVQPQGEGVLITGYSTHWLSAPGGTSLRKSEVSFYSEFGLTQRVTLVGRFALQSLTETRSAPDAVADEAFGNALVAFGGSEAGLRVKLYQSGPWASSVQLSRTFQSGGENRNNQRFGTGGGDVELRLLAGRALGRDGFASVQLARRDLNDRGGAEWRFDTAVGWPVSPRWRWMAETFSVRADERPGASAYSGHRAQISAVYDAPSGYSLSFGALASLHCKNTAREQAVFARLWRRF
ncbi:MAG: hypothetical protein ACQRW7_04090 [Caulobacterales bacterium]|uniref:hypothetical protein n=1 Tax=Glycocaulis sp. TaxID=1969725 RepID=UPI003FA0123A